MPDRQAVRVETKQKPLRPSKRVAVSTAVSAASANKPQDKAVASSKPVSSADTDKPRWITNVAYQGRPPRPHYPRAAQRRGQMGKVIVRVLISARGEVIDAKEIGRASGRERVCQYV